MTIFGEPSKYERLRLAVLLLAAGAGSRLGGFPKALLKKDGESLLSRFLRSIQHFNLVETLVVTGFHAQAIEAEINSICEMCCKPLVMVSNPNPQAGQSSSVRIGLESLNSDFDVLLIALCDQPKIGSEEIKSLLQQFDQIEPGKGIVLPMVQQQRGNPVLFSKKVIEEILVIPGMVCRPFMDEHPELVESFETNNHAYIQDVDTQADIQKLGIDPI